MSKQAAPRRVGDKEALAVGTTIRGSAQKLNLVAALIRGRKVEEALNILTFSKKAMAVDAKKVLASAIANAENNHNLDVDSLVVAEASVGKSLTMKRFHARGRGKSTRILKPFSRLRIKTNNAPASRAVASELASASPPTGIQPACANRRENAMLKTTFSPMAIAPMMTGVFVYCWA